MGALERVQELKKQNLPDESITSALREEGLSPKEINEALSQSKIKSVVSNEENQENMQPSIMQQPTEEAPPEQAQEQTDAGYEQEAQYAPQEYAQDPYAGAYDQAYQEPYAAGVGTDTVMEIAQQVFEEKITSITKQLEELNEFKTLSQSRIEHMNERLKKIESIIDRLHAEVLNQVGSYGEDIKGIRKEMSMMQNSFGKVINPLTKKKPRKKVSKKK